MKKISRKEFLKTAGAIGTLLTMGGFAEKENVIDFISGQESKEDTETKIESLKNQIAYYYDNYYNKPADKGNSFLINIFSKFTNTDEEKGLPNVIDAAKTYIYKKGYYLCFSPTEDGKYLLSLSKTLKTFKDYEITDDMQTIINAILPEKVDKKITHAVRQPFNLQITKELIENSPFKVEGHASPEMNSITLITRNDKPYPNNKADYKSTLYNEMTNLTIARITDHTIKQSKLNTENKLKAVFYNRLTNEVLSSLVQLYATGRIINDNELFKKQLIEICRSKSCVPSYEFIQEFIVDAMELAAFEHIGYDPSPDKPIDVENYIKEENTEKIKKLLFGQNDVNNILNFGGVMKKVIDIFQQINFSKDPNQEIGKIDKYYNRPTIKLNT